jgi:ketosteroid isomerase-like protein
MNRSPALALLLVGCAHASSGTAPALADDEATRAQLLQADRDFNDATQAKGREGARAFLSDELRVFGETPIGVGRDALLDQWNLMWAGKAKITWAPDSASYLPQAAIGITTGRWKFEAPARTVTGRYVTIWKRQADGSWKAIADGGSPDCPKCEPAPAAH